MRLILQSVLLIFIFSSTVFSQFPYGQANLTKGSMICKTVTTVTETIQKKMISKSVEESEFSCSLLYSFYKNAEDLDEITRTVKSRNHLPHLLTGMSFIRTLNEKESFPAKVPKFPVTLSFKGEYSRIDPCNENNEDLKLAQKSMGTGMAREGNKVQIGFEGIKGETGHFIVKVLAGGAFGPTADISLMGQELKKELPDEDCKWKEIEGGLGHILTGPQVSAFFLNGTELSPKFKGSNGRYKSFEDLSEQGIIVEEEYNLFKIDTAGIYSYIRNKVPFKQYALMGSYRKVITDKATGNKTEYDEVSTLKINFGEFKNDLLIATVNKEDYHDWLPFRKGEEGYMPLQIKAELNSQDTEPKDTLHFYLEEVTRYPGYSANYPKYENKQKPDYSADLFFSPTQSDGNVEYIDSFHVKTNSRVKSASVDVECRDYGAYARLKVRAIMKNVSGFNEYDNSEGLKIPEDENNNFIADKWEKDTGIFDKNPGAMTDNDEFPKEQKDNGDGISVFEEYRGFFVKKDYCQQSENNFRHGRHIRTDPKWKDIFVYDNTNTLFQNYYSPSNASQLNWHLMDDNEIKKVSAAAINGWLVKDGVETQALLDYLDGQDHRLINDNTPDKFRIAKHYGVFLFYSDLLTGTSTAGRNVPNDSKPTPLSKSEFIEFQKFAPFEKSIHDNSPVVFTCTNTSQCNFHKVDFRTGDFTCPVCKGLLKMTNYLTYEEETRIAELIYSSTVIHEIGHAMGIPHHSNGAAKFTGPDNKVIRVTSTSTNGVSYRDAEEALSTCGIIDCVMRYNFFNIDEFRSRQILNTVQNRYCPKDEKYLDQFGDLKPADNCFGQITVK